MLYSEIRKHVKKIVDDYNLNSMIKELENEYEVEIQGISHFIEKYESCLTKESLSEHIQLMFHLLTDASDCSNMANDIIKKLKEVDSCFGCDRKVKCQKIIDCHNITLCEVDMNKKSKIGRCNAKFNQSMKKIKNMLDGDKDMKIKKMDYPLPEEHFSISTSTNNRSYIIDFDKVDTWDDIKLILETITTALNIHICEDYEKFNELKKLLKKEGDK